MPATEGSSAATRSASTTAKTCRTSVEERLRLGQKFTSTFFLGIACVYGGGKSCSDDKNLFPAAGTGVQYALKPKEGIVLNLEYALGKNDNYGVYLKMGYAY